MKFNIFIFFIHFGSLLPVLIATSYSVQDLRNIFQRELCIEGTLDSVYFKKNDNTKDDIKVENILSLSSVGTAKETEKPVLSRLNELAGFHQIDYYFTLEKEDGPPHQRFFTISVTFGKEKYFGQGTSLKKAKQDAAIKALEKTEYEFPKSKEKTPGDIEQLTPTVLLNNLGSKLGIEIIYYLLDKDKEEILHSNIILTEKNKSYLKKLNESIYSTKNLKMKKDIDMTKGPFRIKLKFDEHIFYTTSHSIQSGRHEVASMALEFLANNRENLNFACLKEGSEDECKKNKDQLKSPISKVYEQASKRNLDLEFELIEESGPSHKRNFVTECRLGDMKTTGKDTSKKGSKRIAAALMLDKLEELDPFSTIPEVKNVVTSKKRRKKKDKMIKNKFDEMRMTLDNIKNSVMKFANHMLNEEDQDGESTDKFEGNDNENKKSTQPKQKSNTKLDGDGTKSFQDELLEMSNVLNFKVAFTDFNEEKKHISLLSLYTNPEYTCFGEDKSEFLARNVAAKNGLDLLSKIGIYDLFLEETNVPLERETKEEIRVILGSQGISKDKEEL